MMLEFERYINNFNNYISNLFVFINLVFIPIEEFIIYTFSTISYKEFIYKVAKRFAKKNILCVKIFQAIALNNNFISDVLNAELISFTDSVPYSDEDIDFLLLEKLRNVYNLKIARCPINSGMISLVYKAKLLNEQNKYVALKIKRKNIDDQLYSACKQFRFINWFLSFLPFYKSMNLHSTIENVLISSIAQLDFSVEVKNTEEMRKICKHLEYVKIPEIYKEVTQKYADVIMMEFIEGKHISQVDPVDYEIYAKHVLKYGFVTAFIGGITHADMHAGNILFLKDYKIAPIDFGLVTKMNNNVLRDTMVDVASDLFTCDAEDCAEKLISVLLNPPDLKKTMHEYYYCELVYIVSDIIRETLCKRTNCDQVRIYEFLMKFNKFLQTSSLKIEPNEYFLKLQSAIAMSNGISMTLCKNEYVRIINEVLNELFHLNLFMEK
jgi:predicted unusual protein kinase regulating ubiquinone biosynthesis (AarF/ABC1/UbiB family)